ncbi:Hemerythrin HHE cation binding domain-containing protein [Micromonospora nigra]|uniref:Hemerythrin HHE cation binding domain-containing protein n=1 Tax=Micromonospora nigra TaxID=145857 RepID=A0A1C6T277_9ACTN|nr:hemerythrin domain-containing protein [Micromonospora nigra]SCL35910.1 Hemerythrin HHE cation binding domain-containing protein [Micromonospora nigra]
MTVNLPPLPPVPGEEHRPGGRSIADLVDAEHRQLRELTRRLADPDADPAGALDVLVAELSRHLSAEEQYLLPAVRAAVPGTDDRVAEVLAADAGLRSALRGLGRGSIDDVTTRIDAHVAAVGDLVDRLRASATEEELIRLGNRLEIAEEAAPTRPHSGIPTTPPWNRIVEPAVGVVDKVRDAVTGRSTHLRDLTEPPTE